MGKYKPCKKCNDTRVVVVNGKEVKCKRCKEHNLNHNK